MDAERLIVQNKPTFYEKAYELRAYLMTIFSCFLQCVMSYMFKYWTGTRGMPIFILVAMRGSILAIYAIFFIAINFEDVSKRFNLKKIHHLAIRSGITAFGSISFIYALAFLRVSTAEILLRVGVVMSVYLSFCLLKEKVTIYDVYSLFGTLVGVVFILKPAFLFGGSTNGEDTIFGLFCGSCVAVISAFGITLSKKLMNDFDEKFIILAMGLGTVIIVFIIWQISGYTYEFTLYDMLGLVVTMAGEFLSFVLMFKSMKLESIPKLAPFTNSRLVFAVLIGMIFFNSVDRYDIIGIALIIGVYVYASVAKLKEMNINK